jgi:L-lactate dehydrogenase
MNNKVVIIGCGNVGMAYAYALLNQGSRVDELVLVDINKERLEGEVMDLNHTLPYTSLKVNIKVGDYSDCNGATLVVIAAGANQKEGETRLDLLNKNSAIFKDIIGKVMENNFDGIFLIATNPLDVMTYLTWKFSKLPSNRVIGSGTTLDTARLQYMVGERTNINPKDVDAYVIGEHGDSEFIPWSSAVIAQQDINEFISKEEQEKIADDVKNSAYEIINRKGATYYGIGVSLVKLTNAILEDENTIFTVSNYDPDNQIYISTPCILNKNGIQKRIFVDLNEEETKKMQHSVDVIKEAIKSINE